MNAHTFTASIDNKNLCAECGRNVFAFVHGNNKSTINTTKVRKNLACKFCRHAFAHHNDDGCDKCFSRTKECVGYWK